MLDQRRRRWTNIAQILYKCFVFNRLKKSVWLADRIAVIRDGICLKQKNLQMLGLKLNKYE